MTNIIEETNKKNLVLAAWTKDRVNEVANVKQEWSNFQSMLENQQFYIDRQVRTLITKGECEGTIYGTFFFLSGRFY